MYGVWHKRSGFRTQNRVEFLVPTEHVSGVVRITGSTGVGTVSGRGSNAHSDQRKSHQHSVDVVGRVAGICPVADGCVATKACRGEAEEDVAGADAETLELGKLFVPYSVRVA